MAYQPKFCCQCGEKIERVNWNLLTSRRFCELCQTDFATQDKMPWFIALVGILIGLFGVGSYLRTPVANNPAPMQFISRNPNKTETNQANLSNSKANTRIEKNVNKPVIENAPTEKLTTKKDEITSNPAEEPVFMCGAATKKGTPCSRRVKGGGRCWQHEGQPAMMPQEKLILSSETRAK
jgi:hypothetical protein